MIVVYKYPEETENRKVINLLTSPTGHAKKVSL